MKHLFTLLAGLSLLIWLFLIVATAATFTSDWRIPLGPGAQRNYSLQTGFGDVKLNGFLADPGPKGATMTDHIYLWCDLQKHTRDADPTTGETEATGFSFVMPAAFPIVLFAILPAARAVHVVHRRRRKKNEAVPAKNGSSTGQPRSS